MKSIAVIGGGITGLSAAYFLNQTGNFKITVIEKEKKLGGKIQTKKENGCLIETGPESFVTHKPWGLKLCRSLGLENELIEPSPEAKGTLMLFRRKLMKLPDRILSVSSQPLGSLARSFMQTPVLSWKGKLRLLVSQFIPPSAQADDESLESFFSRNFGEEFFQNLAGPLLSGIFGEGAGELSARALFPQLYEAALRGEKLHASLRPERRSPRIASPGSQSAGLNSRPGGSGFTTLRDGLGTLIEKLSSALNGCEVLAETGARSLEKTNAGWKLLLENGEAKEFDAVILTVTSSAAAHLVQGIEPSLAEKLSEIPYASSSVITLAFQKSAVKRPLNAHGFMVHPAENLPITACTLSSAKWPGRAPPEFILARTYIPRAGGDSAKLKIEAAAALRPILQIEEDPVFVRVDSHSQARYAVGHPNRVSKIREILSTRRDLCIAGSAYDGAGIPDCIQSAKTVSDQIIAQTGAA